MLTSIIFVGHCARRFANCWKISCCKYTNLCMVNGLLIFRVSLVLIRKYFQVFLRMILHYAQKKLKRTLY
uniref:Uncharacterized protein n=1 Tax=Hyaloperonospora arabidopsidis (strain Emoy2) TaxID=559515 RepID=M4BT02_HYAAE